MKALLLRISVGIAGLGALVYFLACSPATQNNNSNQNQAIAPNQNQANGNVSSKDLRPCEYGLPPGSQAQQIKKDIEAKMGPSLKKLLKDPANPNGTFTVEVQKASGGTYFVAYIKGKISGDDNLKQLSNILNDFQGKEQCLRVIHFLPNQLTATDGGGFEWSSCEHPMVVCPNGECCIPATGNTNTNMNANVNANVNSNANANGNRN